MSERRMEPHRQRGWRSESGQWSGLREVAKEFRAAPTPAEAVLWEALRKRKLGVRFRRQHAVGRFLVDFYCAQESLVVEVDGAVHEHQVEEDRARQVELEMRGLRVIRFSNDEGLGELESVLGRIGENLTPSPSPTSERGTLELGD